MDVTCPVSFPCWDLNPLGFRLFSLAGLLGSNPLCWTQLLDSSLTSTPLDCWALAPSLPFSLSCQAPICLSVHKAPWSWLCPSWCWIPWPCLSFKCAGPPCPSCASLGTRSPQPCLASTCTRLQLPSQTASRI